MLKKTISLAVIAFLLVTFAGCGNEKTSTDDKNNNAESSETTAKITYNTIKTVDIPAAYPHNKFPLSQNSEDKIIKVHDASDGTLFDLKIVSTRSAKEIVNEYTNIWELEDEDIMFNDDLESATLTGTAYGFEAIVTGCDQSPDIPKGAKTYCAILVKVKK